jgi:hypothetical protein
MIKVTDEMREIGVTPPTWLCAAASSPTTLASEPNHLKR